MKQGRLRRARVALLVAFTLPFSHTALAVDIHYARAIGDPYEYRPPALPAAGEEASAGPAAPGAAGPERDRDALPGLGTESPAPAREEGGRVWPRVLIGVLLVGTMAALASKGGGDGEVRVNAGVDLGGGAPPPGGSAGGGGGSSGGSAPAPAPPAGAPAGGGSGDSSGGGGGGGPVITIGTGGGPAGGGNRDDDDEDDDKGKKGKDDKKKGK